MKKHILFLIFCISCSHSIYEMHNKTEQKMQERIQKISNKHGTSIVPEILKNGEYKII